MRKIFILLLLAGPAWAAWTNTYTVTIDRTLCGVANQTNFPVMISISDNALKTVANGGLVTNSSGFDIVVATDSTIATLVPWEVKAWNGTTGTWVGWALLSFNGSGAGSNTTFGFAIGNSAVTTQQNVSAFAPSAVWDSNYKGVWHLGDGSTLNVLDSTTNGNNGTNSGATAGGAGCNSNCDGSASTSGGNHIDVASTGFPTGAHALTMSAWAQGGVGGPAVNTIFTIGNMSVANQGAAITVITSLQAGSAGHLQTTGTAVNAWTYVVLTYDGTTQRIYGDGVLANSSTQSWNITLTHQTIGNDGLAEYFNGLISECRLSNSVRSADWILTEFNNQHNPGSIGTPGFLIWPTASVSHGFPSIR